MESQWESILVNLFSIVIYSPPGVRVNVIVDVVDESDKVDKVVERYPYYHQSRCQSASSR